MSLHGFLLNLRFSQESSLARGGQDETYEQGACRCSIVIMHAKHVSTQSLSVEQKMGKAGREDPCLFTRTFTGDIGFNAVSMQYHWLGLTAMPEQSLSQHLQHDHWVVLLFVLCDTTSGRLLTCCYSSKLQVTLGPFSPGRLLDSLRGPPTNTDQRPTRAIHFSSPPTSPGRLSGQRVYRRSSVLPFYFVGFFSDTSCLVSCLVAVSICIVRLAGPTLLLL